ncbi:hypothetical protein [uncultured Maricaulis sp.]|jgi:hypothetical protein|uniref:hypothetical protein n=1 Tax=uncultured Maricaulis sp. TaxID=174710 RepID=UPI0030D74F74
MKPDFRPHPIAMEPARAAAAAKYRTATGGQKTRRLKELRDLTTEALIWDRRRRNG